MSLKIDKGGAFFTGEGCIKVSFPVMKSISLKLGKNVIIQR